MKRKRYHFNPETVTYEEVVLTKREKTLKVFKHLIASLFFTVAIIAGILFFFDLSREHSLAKENKKLLAQFNHLNSELTQIKEVLSDLEQRDDNIYRVIFEAKPIHKSVRRAGIGGINRYQYLKTLNNADLVISTSKKLDQISRSLYVQSKSYDEVEDLAKNKIKMLKAIPAILPLSINNLGWISSGYGKRIDPQYKTPKFHKGMDFTGAMNTPIYATADGVVEVVHRERGYGKKIILNHGYGYKTLYAHLNGFNVKKNQKVKRGDVIGFLGNTGKSTGPHLHYEVRKDNIAVNPINYYFNDITAEEYDNMVTQAENNGQSLD